MATDKASGAAQGRAEKLADELGRLSDAVRARNAGATSEVRAAVDVVADELRAMARGVRATAAPAQLRDEAALHAHLALLEARDRLAVLDEPVRGALAGAARVSTFIGETAKMKLALAKLEASDLFEEKRRRLVEQRRRVEQLRDAALDDIDDRLADLIGQAMLK